MKRIDHLAIIQAWRCARSAAVASRNVHAIACEALLRHQALSTRPEGPENALALLTMCEEIERSPIDHDIDEVQLASSQASIIAARAA